MEFVITPELAVQLAEPLSNPGFNRSWALVDAAGVAETWLELALSPTEFTAETT